MSKRIVLFLLSFLLLVHFTACTGDGPAIVGEQTSARMITDDCGREVEIPAEIDAIAASGPLSQIILYAIAPELLCGLAAKFSDSAKNYIPAKYFDLPYFGQLYSSSDLNVEALAAAKPQLIVDVGEAKKTVMEDLNDLQRQTQIPSIHIEASLASMPQAYRKLGKILGKEEKAEALAQFCEKVYSRTISIMDKVGNNKVRALYVLGEEGRNVLAKGSYHAELIDLLTENLAVMENPTSKGLGNEVTLEQIFLWDPDFILFAPDGIYDTVHEQEAWKELSAVQNQNYLEVPKEPYNWMGFPPSVQRYLGMIWLTAELYPQYCEYDVKAEILEYYELFYGCSLTDEQYSKLIKSDCAIVSSG